MERVFLDANVLFSAGYDPSCRIAKLWRLDDTELLASQFVAEEAVRNMETKYPEGLKSLGRLMNQCRWIEDVNLHVIPASVDLPEKDRPILAAAISGAADYLLTGDKHFRPLFGRVVQNVMIMRPGDYLRMRKL
jgi:uncharacterized protein